jgi:hypothetical protein
MLIEVEENVVFRVVNFVYALHPRDEVLNIKKVLKDQNWSLNPICNRLG